MEYSGMDPVASGGELLRLLIPVVMENVRISDADTLTNILIDSCYALLLYKAAPGPATDRVSEQEPALMEFLQRDHHVLCFSFRGHSMGIISYMTQDRIEVRRKTEEMEASIGKYLTELLNDSGVEINLSIGRPFVGLLKLQESYSELVNAAAVFALRPGQLVVSEYDIVSDPALLGAPYPCSEIERQLANAVIDLEIHKAAGIMESIIQHELSSMQLKLSFLPRMAVRTEWILIVLHVPRNSGDTKSSQIYSYPQRIKYSESVEEGVELIHEFFNRLDDYYKAFRFSIGKDISQITGYIHTDAANPSFSATMICDRFRISPSYLSRMFKQRTGVKLVDYIHITRIEMAKSLLESTDMSIADIGKKVGYTNSAGFSTTFKRYESITPREYRDRFLLNH